MAAGGAIQTVIGTNASQIACPSTMGTTMGWTPVEKTLGATAATTRSVTATIARQVVVADRERNLSRTRPATLPAEREPCGIY